LRHLSSAPQGVKRVAKSHYSVHLTSNTPMFNDTDGTIHKDETAGSYVTAVQAALSQGTPAAFPASGRKASSRAIHEHQRIPFNESIPLSTFASCWVRQRHCSTQSASTPWHNKGYSSR